MSGPTGVEAEVCRDIAARQQAGIAKYGRTLAESEDDMLVHAFEEALDLACYLKAEIIKRRTPVIRYVARPKGHIGDFTRKEFDGNAYDQTQWGVYNTEGYFFCGWCTREAAEQIAAERNLYK